jgi:cytoskeletal protein RodZ
MDRKWALAIGAIVLVVVLALLAVQCSDDEDDDSTTTTEESTTTSEETTTSTSEDTTTTSEDTTTTAPDEDVAVVLVATGLQVDDADLDFEADADDAVAAIADVLGPPSEEGDQDECPAGPATFAAWDEVGLSLTFQEDVFVGWSARPTSTLQTSEGIGIGSTVGDLQAAYPGTTFTTTSLGEEFDADGIFGVATDSAASGEVTDMWAGITCIFR